MPQLGLEALEQAIAKDEAQAEKQDPELRKDNAAKRRASRGALSAHRPRVEVTLAPPAPNSAPLPLTNRRISP
jgi:transposase